MSSAPLIQTRNLVKRFGNQVAVNEISLTVNRGDIYGFLGLNGAGKTTSLRLLMGLMKPDEGEISLFGETSPSARRREMARVGAMVESPSFYSHLSGRRNLELLGGLGSSPDRARVEHILEIVGLADAGNKKARHYSLGMKQRLAIGLALLGDPELVVLDEPANGLDPNGIIEMRRLIKRLNEEQGTTFVVSSHLLYEIELMCNRIIILEKGRLLYEGPPEDFGRQEIPRFRIKGPDLTTIATQLEQHESATILEADPEGVLIACQFTALPDLHRFLVESGTAVHTISEERMTLEEFFLEQSAEQREGSLR